MKKYLMCVIETREGRTVSNPLKLSEAYLIGKMAQENKSVTVSVKETDARDYKIIFG